MQFNFHDARRGNVVFTAQAITEYMYTSLLESMFLEGIHVMAIIRKHLKDTVGFSSFLVCDKQNKVSIIRDLLPSISLAVGQSPMNISRK